MQGNLSEFVKVRPEAKAYYELGSAKLKFVLPRPGFLDGVKGRDVAVLRMTNVSFTYPATTRRVLRDVTVRCNLNSRVAVLGVRPRPARPPFCCSPNAPAPPHPPLRLKLPPPCDVRWRKPVDEMS